jgi:hypothetical protein
MGIFSKTKTYIDSHTMAIFSDSPDTVRQSVLSSILLDRPISTDLQSNLIAGLGLKAESYFRYGRDKYTHGLPEGYNEVRYGSAYTVELVLDSLYYPERHSVDMNLFSKANATYFVLDHLLVTREWDDDTGIISTPFFNSQGEVVYLHATEWESSTQIKLTYKYGSSFESEIITLTTSIDIEASYYHVGYYKESDPTTKLYWFYNPTEELYESLNVGSNTPEQVYFPVVPLRRDNVDLTSDNEPETDLQITSKKLMRKLGLDFVDIGKSIHESPDIDGVDHAYFTLGVPIQSDNKHSKDYLFQYFLRLSQNDLYKVKDWQEWADSPDPYKITNPPPMNIINIEEVEQSNGATPDKGYYRTEIGYRFIEVQTFQGNLNQFEVAGTPLVRRNRVTSTTQIKPSIRYKSYAFEDSIIIFRKQITVDSFTEIIVVGAKHINYIYGGKHIDTDLADSLDNEGDKNNFVIPLNIDVFKGMPLPSRTDLIKDAARLHFHSVVRIKLKWYQTAIFRAIIIIIGAILTVLSFGTDGGGSLAFALSVTGTTAAGFASLAFVIQVAIAIVVNTIVSLALGLVLDIIGAKNFAILEFLYLVYSFSQGTGFQNISDVFTVVNGVTGAYTKYMQGEYQEIASMSEQFEEQANADQDELDKLMETFPPSYLNPLAHPNNNALNTGLSPEQYYNIRIHKGNPGTLLLAEPSYFVESNLRLPSVSDVGGLNFD